MKAVLTMHDDPRIKRILKRYLKGSVLSDAIMDVTSLGIGELMLACRLQESTALDAPKQLDDEALAHLTNRMGISFEPNTFDYFIHSYVRSEFIPGYYADPSVISKPAPEVGPPPGIPLEKGMRWVSVRPKDGLEHYEAYDNDEPKSEK